MRSALTMALQSFEGAMVIVSHDRFLLRATTDDLYLVHDRKVAQFNGDLHDYHQWLTEQQRSERRQEQAESAKPAGANTQAARKEQKRLDAEFRRQTAPIRKKIDSLDTKLEKFSATIADVESALAEPSIYEASNKDKLTELLRRQAEAKSSLEEVELEWMDLQEQLEVMEAEFQSR